MSRRRVVGAQPTLARLKTRTLRWRGCKPRLPNVKSTRPVGALSKRATYTGACWKRATHAGAVANRAYPSTRPVGALSKRAT